MTLPKKNPLMKLTKLTSLQKARRKRLNKDFKRSPSTQNSIYFTSQYETGTMHITDNLYSRSYRLGDFAYNTASTMDKLQVIDSYGEALNSLDAGDRFQLLVLNRRVNNDTVKQVLYEPADDGYNDYREEYNDLIQSRFSLEAKNFKVEKIVTLATEAYDRHLADNQLREIGKSVENVFKERSISFEDMDGLDRLEVMSYLLRYSPHLPYTYKDIALSGLRAKNFVVPNRIQFLEDKMRLDNKWAKVLFVRHYPEFLSDNLIKKICDSGVELAITVHAEALEPNKVTTEIANQQALAKRQRVKDQQQGFQKGIDSSLSESQKAVELSEATEKWKKMLSSRSQKVFKGTIAVFFTADTEEELQLYTERVKYAGRKEGVFLEDCFYHQENALNTILPIGKSYLDVKKDFMRPFTTANVATQVPFTTVDLQSDSPWALYYGQNQLSSNLITLDRQRDLNTANGLLMGTSGSGKGMTTKTEEIIPTLLKYPQDRFIIVDPENEYSDIAEEFNGQIINLSTSSKDHINLMDLADTDQVLFDDKGEEIEAVADKSNLLMTLFETILKEVTDDHITIIDRVTELAYQRFSQPTLEEWHDILLEQPEEAATELATKSEIYAKGSLNLFAHPTSVDLSNRLIVFNLKGLKNKLRPFALLVLQDFIWQEVVKYQGKGTIRLYWDELHMTFRNQTDAAFFAELWARIRKYGAIVTGITQNPGTILKWEEGRNLMSNTEFFIILKTKSQDIARLREVVEIPDAMLSYILTPKEKGSGLIIAGGVVVPFENNIPEDTKLYQLTNTDADARTVSG